MVVTINASQPNNIFALGLTFDVASTFIGALPANSFWLVEISFDAARTQSVWRESHTTFTQAQQFFQWTRFTVGFVTAGLFQPKDGDAVKFTAELHSPTAILDTGQINTVFKGDFATQYLQFLALQTLLGTNSSTLAQILASVRKTY